MSALAIPHPAQAVAIAAVSNHLPAEFEDVWVAGQSPPQRRPRMALITRVPGGGVPHHGATDHASYIVECWADTDPEAERLAVVVGAVWRSLAGRWVDGAWLRYAKCAAAYSWPDVDTQHTQARWQFTGELLIKVG